MILAAGLTGFLSFWPMLLASLLGWAILAATRNLPAPASWRLPRPSGTVEGILAAGGALLLICLIVKTLLLSPYMGDAVMYHLPNVAEWVQNRKLVHGFCSDPRIWFPMGFELLETWWVVFLGRDTLIEMAGLQMLILVAVSVGVIARVHGLHPGFSMFVASFIPALILNVTSCGNDLASAAMILAAYALVGARAPLALQAFPLLMGAGIKPTVIFGAAGVLVYFIRADRADRQPWKPALVLLSAGLLLGGFWYFRNFVVKGHPLYPIYGHSEITAHRADPIENFDTLRRTLVELPARAVDPHPFSSLSPDSTSWGWFILPWGLLATLLAVRNDPGFRRLAVGFTAGWFLTIAMSPLCQLNLRYALWFPALFALGAARSPSRPLFAVAVLTAALNLISTLDFGEGRNADPFRIPDACPRTESIACVTLGECPSYLYYNSDFSRRVFYPRSMAELKASRARYVLVWQLPSWAKEIPTWKPAFGKRMYEVP
jgi:hypothetical protein